MTGQVGGKTLRLDRFLDVVCLAKTRSAAARAIREGRVTIDGAKAEASDLVRPGSVIALATGWAVIEVEVITVPDQSVSRHDAKQHYRILREDRS